MHVGHMGMNLLQQAYQTQTAAASAPANQARAAAFAAATDSVDETDEADETPHTPHAASKSHGGSTNSASGPRSSLLSSSTLASLLGLQMVNGQDEDGTDGENEPDMAVAGGFHPNAQLSQEANEAVSPEA